MTVYRIFETDVFTSRLEALIHSGERGIRKKLDQTIYPHLRSSPHFGPQIKKLKNYQPETWRYRIGNYRIFYGIDENSRIVSILTVDHRKDSYK